MITRQKMGAMDKVLIVDDDLEFLTVLKGRLGRYEAQFEVLTASDGEEAIKGLKRERISVLVTDLEMPKVDGLELLAHMTANHPTTPCIVMAEHGSPVKEKGEEQKSLLCVEKPFDFNELACAIIEGLNRLDEGELRARVSVRDFVRLIEVGQKTCLLEVYSRKKRTGFLYFMKGVLFNALCGDLQGEDAAMKLIGRDRAQIRIRCFPEICAGQRKNIIIAGRQRAEGYDPRRDRRPRSGCSIGMGR